MHAEGNLHRLDRRFQLGHGALLFEMSPVQPAEQLELPGLVGLCDARIAHVGDELLWVRLVVLDVRPLVAARQERRRPKLWADHRHAGTQNDIAGQVLVLGAETVGQPRPHRRMAREPAAAVHHEQRRLVKRHIGVHRLDDAQIVGVACEVAEDLADLEAALAVRLELERGAHQRARLALGLEVAAGIRFAVVLREHRLVVEAIDVRRAAVEKQVDDVLRLGREVWRLHGQQVGARCGGCGGRQQPRQAHHAQPRAASAQQLPPGNAGRPIVDHHRHSLIERKGIRSRSSIRVRIVASGSCRRQESGVRP